MPALFVAVLDLVVLFFAVLPVLFVAVLFVAVPGLVALFFAVLPVLFVGVLGLVALFLVEEVLLTEPFLVGLSFAAVVFAVAFFVVVVFLSAALVFAAPFLSGVLLAAVFFSVLPCGVFLAETFFVVVTFFEAFVAGPVRGAEACATPASLRFFRGGKLSPILSSSTQVRSHPALGPCGGLWPGGSPLSLRWFASRR